MRIGRVVHVFKPDVIGDPFNSFALSLRQSILRRVTVFTWAKNGDSCIEYVNENFKILRLKGLNMSLKPLFAEYPWVPNLFEMIEREELDVIHAHSHLFPTTFSSIRIAKKLGIPTIVSVHGIMAERDVVTNIFQNLYLRSLSSWGFTNSTMTICLTKNDARYVLKLGCPYERIRIVPNPVDTERFKPQPKKEKDNLIVWTGRYVPEKGLEYLIKAAKIVVRINSRIKFLLIGGGPEKSRLTDLIKSHGLEQNVFLVGPVEKEEIVKYLAQACLFVFPSLKEGMPKSVLEALSTGKPVIAFDIPSVSEIVKEGVNGILVPKKKSEKMAEAIMTLLADDGLRRRLSENARKIVLSKFTWNIVLNKLDNVYNEALEIGRGD